MKGVVLHFNEEQQSGIITGEDENRYSFKVEEFKSDGKIRSGIRVDFVTDQNIAKDIYKDVNATNANISNFDKSEIIQKLIGLFTSGMFNKAGFIASCIVLLATFIPYVNLYHLHINLVETRYIGKIILVLALVNCAFFYGGIKRIYLKISNAILSSFVCYGYLGLILSIAGVNSLSRDLGYGGGASLDFGFFVGIIALGAVAYFTYFDTKYKENENTF